MTKPPYSRLQIILHWTMALLFVSNYLLSDGMGDFFQRYLEGDASWSDWAVSSHIYVGVAFLLFAVVRMAIRPNPNPAGADENAQPLHERLAGRVHNILYLLMFIGPVAGMSALYAKTEILGQFHHLLMNFMLAIIAIHLVAMLYHQFILKDKLLSRMSLFKQFSRRNS